MKQTILTSKQSDLLEKLIVKYGQIVTTQQIYQVADDLWKRQQTKNYSPNLWIMAGWFVSNVVSMLFLILVIVDSYHFHPFGSQLLVKDSYVSFESALSYHGMFDQLTGKSISLPTVAIKPCN